MPNQPTEPDTSNNQQKDDPKIDDAYAQSLLQSLDARLEMEQKTRPAPSFISKKKLIFIAIVLVLAIILSFAISAMVKAPA